MKHLLFLDAVKPGEIFLFVVIPIIVVLSIPFIAYKRGYKNGYTKGRYDEIKENQNAKK